MSGLSNDWTLVMVTIDGAPIFHLNWNWSGQEPTKWLSRIVCWWLKKLSHHSTSWSLVYFLVRSIFFVSPLGTAFNISFALQSNYRKPIFCGRHTTFVLRHGLPHPENATRAYIPLVAPIVNSMSIVWHTTMSGCGLYHIFFIRKTWLKLILLRDARTLIDVPSSSTQTRLKS